MPEDSIMDMVNNIEPLYNDKMALFDQWLGQGDAWSKEKATKDARALASHFAEALESGYVRGKYRERDINQAAREMLEEFDDYKEQAIQEVVERERIPWKPEEMTPEDVEFAKRCDGIAKKIGVELLREIIPASPERIRKALETGDSHLNTIPLRKWDQAAGQIPYLPSKGLSLSEKVCALKHVAKWYYA